MNGFKPVDIDAWGRRKAFEFFQPFEDPFFNVTVTLGVTALFELAKKLDLPFSAAILYFSQKAANSVREFRIRNVDGRLVEFERVDCTQTILQDNESFSFSYVDWSEGLRDFCDRAKVSFARYKELDTFDVESERLDLIYYSVLPWLAFTSFKHASRKNPLATVPRIVFGKFIKSADGVSMPVSVEVNHMIADGIHVGKYIERFQSFLDDCESEIS